MVICTLNRNEDRLCMHGIGKHPCAFGAQSLLHDQADANHATSASAGVAEYMKHNDAVYRLTSVGSRRGFDAVAARMEYGAMSWCASCWS